MTFLFIVENVFQVTGRVCMIVPSLPVSKVDFHLRVKDTIQIRHTGGQILNTHIADIAMLSGPNFKGRMAFILPKDVAMQDVAIGAEIWVNY